VIFNIFHMEPQNLLLWIGLEVKNLPILVYCNETVGIIILIYLQKRAILLSKKLSSHMISLMKLRMFKPKSSISAVFASPKGGLERDGGLENSSGKLMHGQSGYSVPHWVFDIITLWEPLLKGDDVTSEFRSALWV